MIYFMRSALLALIVIASLSLHGLDRALSQSTDTAAAIEGAKHLKAGSLRAGSNLAGFVAQKRFLLRDNPNWPV